MKACLSAVVVVCLLVVGACSVSTQSVVKPSTLTAISFGKYIYQTEMALPNFTDWNGTLESLYTGENVNIGAWIGEGPNDDCVLIVAVAQEFDGKVDVHIAFLVYVTDVSKTPQEVILADVPFCKGKDPSFILSKVKNIPKLDVYMAGGVSKWKM